MICCHLLVRFIVTNFWFIVKKYDLLSPACGLINKDSKKYDLLALVLWAIVTDKMQHDLLPSGCA